MKSFTHIILGKGREPKKYLLMKYHWSVYDKRQGFKNINNIRAMLSSREFFVHKIPHVVFRFLTKEGRLGRREIHWFCEAQHDAPLYICSVYKSKKPRGRPITSRPTVQPNILSPAWDLLILGSLGFRPHRALRHCGLSFMDYALALKKKLDWHFERPFFRNVDHRVDFESCPSLRLGAYNTFLWRSSRLKRYILQEGRRWRSMTAPQKSVSMVVHQSLTFFYIFEMLL